MGFRAASGWRGVPAERGARPNYEGFVARGFLRARRRGFLSLIGGLTAVGFIVGTAALVIALALMTGFRREVARRIVDVDADLLIAATRHRAAFDETDRVIERIAGVPGVAGAEAQIRGYAALCRGETIRLTVVTGHDPARAGTVALATRRMSDGTLSRAAAIRAAGRRGIVLGTVLAERLGVSPGDTVRLVALRPRLTPWGVGVRQPSFDVAGLFSSGFREFDETWSFVDLDHARDLFDPAEAGQWVAARLADAAAKDDVKEALEEALGPGFLVEDALSRFAAFFGALALQKLFMTIVIGLIMIVAAFGVASLLTLTVSAKTRELGVLGALGASAGGVRRIFVRFGATLGLAGSLAGVTIGALLSLAADRFAWIRLDPEIYYLDRLPFDVRPLDVLLIVVAATGLAALAALYPAYRASRLGPVQALHRD